MSVENFFLRGLWVCFGYENKVTFLRIPYYWKISLENSLVYNYPRRRLNVGEFSWNEKCLTRFFFIIVRCEIFFWIVIIAFVIDFIRTSRWLVIRLFLVVIIITFVLSIKINHQSKSTNHLITKPNYQTLSKIISIAIDHRGYLHQLELVAFRELKDWDVVIITFVLSIKINLITKPKS